VIRSNAMKELFDQAHVTTDEIAKVAVGPEKWQEATFSPWEELMSEIVTGDAFGVDRIDYLLRDSLHAGVAYGRFDHYRLIDSLRILWDDEQQKAVIRIEQGAVHAAEAMQLARYYMFEQLYYHRVRLALDAHLRAYLRHFLGGAGYPTAVENHLRITDDHVLARMQDDAADSSAEGHELARRILDRKFFRLLYDRRAEDLDVNLNAVDLVFQAAVQEFGEDLVLRESNISRDRPESAAPKPFRFAVEREGGEVVSSLQVSQSLGRLPKAVYDHVFVAPEIKDKARRWLQDNRRGILGSGEDS
jgi:HD superfamily phosphohydrolase